jgi:hypothetical protein
MLITAESRMLLQPCINSIPIYLYIYIGMHNIRCIYNSVSLESGIGHFLAFSLVFKVAVFLFVLIIGFKD